LTAALSRPAEALHHDPADGQLTPGPEAAVFHHRTERLEMTNEVNYFEIGTPDPEAAKSF
jgi:hypothetical protein